MSASPLSLFTPDDVCSESKTLNKLCNESSLTDIKKIIEECGIVGAGGAGFPSHVKIDSRANTILLNCAECEPLLQADRQLLAKYAYEILAALSNLAKSLGATAVIAVKKSYAATILAVQKSLVEYPHILLVELNDIYPVGDEIVLIYEALGIVVPPGSLPIEVGCIVFNVETVYNMYHAFKHRQHVTHKWVTIIGEVEHPTTALFPLGMPIAEAIKQAGEVTVSNPTFVIGGPMMGTIAQPTAQITKTTNAVLVLPSEHILKNSTSSQSFVNLNRVASACCQCRTCTEMCPRNLLGYPIEPHRIMRALAARDASSKALHGMMYCSLCGLCEKVACPQSLAPRSLIKTFKTALAKEGIRPEKCKADSTSHTRNGRMVNASRLKMRLGLAKYDVNAPME